MKLSNLFVGRLSRQNYLLSMFIFLFPITFSLFVYWIAAIIYALTGSAINIYDSLVLSLLYNIWLLFILVWHVIFPLSIYIRRFHDRNKSGWYSLLILMPLVNVLVTLYLFFAPTIEPNKFGSANKGLSIKQVLGFSTLSE